MKKFYLLTLTLLTCLSSFAQLTEGFEGTWPPPGWGIYDNGIGTTSTWQQSPAGSSVLPAYEGQHAAYLPSVNVSSGMPEDWLVTPLVTVPNNGQLRFYSRLTINANDGSIYQIRISESADQAALGDYTIIQTWTEPQINPTQQQYTEKVVPLPAELAGQQIYIAFVMLGDDGDRWLVDNVSVIEQCLDPENLSAFNITQESADLTWDNPSGATQWEIEFIPQTAAPNGSGTVYTGALPYHVDGLSFDTGYKFYVRALCGTGAMSEWEGPYTFATVSPGASCEAPKIVTALPYSNSDNTIDFGNDYFGEAGTSCGTPPFEQYLNGNDIVYAYTPAEDQVLEAKVSALSQAFAGIFVYTGCDNIGTECYAGGFNGDSFADIATGQFHVSAGTTYYFVIDNAGGADDMSFTLDIEAIECPYPVALQLSDVTVTSAHISWQEFGDAASWEYALQPEGAGMPTGAGTTINDTEYDAAGLAENTSYEFYVRANCGGGSFSQWVGPLNIHTLCNPLGVPFTEGFNSDSSTQGCWVTRNISGTAVWNLDNPSDPFEGDEAAVMNPGFGTNNEDWLISPGINLQANHRLRFHQKVQGFFGGGIAFRLLMSTTGTDASDFTTVLLPSEVYNNNEYVEHEIFLNTVPAGTVYFAWVTETGGVAALHIDNVIVDPMPACPEPTDLTASGFTTSSAELSWEPGFTETSWEVVVQAPGTGVPTGAGTPASNPFTATALTPNTEYEYYVRATCGGTSGNSEWSGPFLFRTTCVAFDVPFYESFNSDSETEYCWMIVDENGGWDKWIMNNTENTYEGDESARFSSEFSAFNDDWLISPAINLTGNERLTYQYRVYQSDYPVAVEVLLSTTGTDPEDFTEVLVPMDTYIDPYYLKEVVNLSAYTGPVYIAWHGPNSGIDTGMFYYVDDVIVEPIPDCADPYNLIVSNVSQTSAELSWTPGNGETTWEVVVVPAGEAIPTEPGIITSDNPFTIDGLLSGTTYDFYIRSVCGDTNSIWNGPRPFTTRISNDECENAIEVPVNAGIECEVTRGGTLMGATQSPVPFSCENMAIDDVWFEFTATSNLHNITMMDVTGSVPFVHFAVYEDDNCTDPTLVACNNFQHTINVDTFVPGQTYRIRVYSGMGGVTTTFKVCVRTPAPPIAVDNTAHTVEELVHDVLIGSDCAQVSNITWSTGTNFINPETGSEGPNGIAYFDQNGSMFPMEGGIILTTGNALAAEGPEDSLLDDGHSSWLGDADLDAIVLEETGIPMNSTNATVLEFDFVPLIDQMSFDFLFASEEYGTFQCDFSDTFAFLLTDSAGNTVNLAVVPTTGQPVSVVTIRDDEYNDQCESVNEEYFGIYNDNVINRLVAATNFAGQTIPMTASATVVPNTTYHIKMVIADRGGEFQDTRYNSAVFLAAGSFNIGSATLGPDLTVADGTAICANATHTIQSGMSTDIFSFTWKKDGVVIDGANGPDLTVNETGTYTIEAEVIGADCTATDSVLIEFYPAVEDITQAPENLYACIAGNTASFTLTQNDAVIAGAMNPADFTITYHATEADAQAGNNPLASPYQATADGQTIYARVLYEVTGCTGMHTFTLNLVQLPVIAIEEGCENDDYVLEVTFDEDDVNSPDNVSFEWTDEEGTVLGTDVKLTVTTTGIYTVTVTPDSGISCPAIAQVTVDETTCTIQRGISPNGDGDNDSFDLSNLDVSKLSIFNRYGQEVYSRSNYSTEWHGQTKDGNELPTGTYFYMIERRNGENKTGWIYINREQ